MRTREDEEEEEEEDDDDDDTRSIAPCQIVAPLALWYFVCRAGVPSILRDPSIACT